MKLQAEALCAFLMLLASVSGAWALDSGSTMVSGAQLAGTVRVNNLACMEALLNLWANGIEIAGITVTVFLLVRVMTRKPPVAGRRKAVTLAMLPASLALCAPGAVNLLISLAQNNNLFS